MVRKTLQMSEEGFFSYKIINIFFIVDGLKMYFKEKSVPFAGRSEAGGNPEVLCFTVNGISHDLGVVINLLGYTRIA